MKISHKTYIRSLPRSLERRARMKNVMSDLNWDFSFWDNTHYEDKEFDDFVRGGGVKKTEGFLHRISDDLNIKRGPNPGYLYPGQVANHLSVLRLFDHIIKSEVKEDYIFIGEDDLVIKPYAAKVIEKILPQIRDDMFICGVGWGWSARTRLEHMNKSEDQYRLSKVFRFCNPLFFTNLKTIKYIVKNFVNGEIYAPCDVWLHKYLREADSSICRYVIFPCLCKELSFSGDIDSEILTKRIRMSRLGAIKNPTSKEKDELIRVRNEYNNKKEIAKKFWSEKYGL